MNNLIRIFNNFVSLIYFPLKEVILLNLLLFLNLLFSNIIQFFYEKYKNNIFNYGT